MKPENEKIIKQTESLREKSLGLFLLTILEKGYVCK